MDFERSPTQKARARTGSETRLRQAAKRNFSPMPHDRNQDAARIVANPIAALFDVGQVSRRNKSDHGTRTTDRWFQDSSVPSTGIDHGQSRESSRASGKVATVHDQKLERGEGSELHRQSIQLRNDSAIELCRAATRTDGRVGFGNSTLSLNSAGR